MSAELTRRVDGIETKVNEHEGRISTLEIDNARSDEILTRLDKTIEKLDSTVTRISNQMYTWKGSIAVLYLLVGSSITAIIGLIVKIIFKV